MKKFMIFLCILCLAGLASAQVDGTPRRERMQRPQKQAMISFVESANLGLQTAESTPARKAEDGGLDSVGVQSMYGGAYVGSGTFMFYAYPGQEDGKWDLCTQDKIRWVYGTGGDPSNAGSGEIGYRFATGPDTYYALAGYFPNLGIPFAVRTAIVRAPSTRYRHTAEDGTVYYDSMPIYFKLYNYTKVGEQQVLGDEARAYVDVVYPTDPEKYTSLSETVMVPAFCDTAGKTNIFYTPKAEFLNVDETQPMGNDFCVSIMFPIEWDEEGDTVIDPAWNASLLILGVESGDDKISEESHCVYLVHDFQRSTHFWADPRPEDGKRWEDLIAEPEMQPNERYAILPMDLFGSTGEPWMKIYFTEWTALQSANKADRYVQVSPVPAVDYVNFSSYADMSRIEIYSLGGQLVKAVNVSGDTYRMDLTGMNSGMYVARIFSEKGISSKKLIVR